jgi:putative mycofactocin binding protein MftB
VTAPDLAADLEQPWRLHPRVSLRPEPFGALAYHYDNRRLNFLRSPDLVELVKQLEHHPTPRHAFDAQGLDEKRWSSFAKALQALAASDFLLTQSTNER